MPGSKTFAMGFAMPRRYLASAASCNFPHIFARMPWPARRKRCAAVAAIRICVVMVWCPCAVRWANTQMRSAHYIYQRRIAYW